MSKPTRQRMLAGAALGVLLLGFLGGWVGYGFGGLFDDDNDHFECTLYTVLFSILAPLLFAAPARIQLTIFYKDPNVAYGLGVALLYGVVVVAAIASHFLARRLFDVWSTAELLRDWGFFQWFFIFSIPSMFAWAGFWLGGALGITLANWANRRRVLPELKRIEKLMRLSSKKLSRVAEYRESLAEIERRIQSIVESDVANLRVARKKLAEDIRGVDSSELAKRLNELKEDVASASRSCDTARAAVDEATGTLKRLQTDERKVQSEIELLVSRDPANAKVVIGKLQSEWKELDLGALESINTSGSIPATYRRLLLVKAKIADATRDLSAAEATLRRAGASRSATQLGEEVLKLELAKSNAKLDFDPTEEASRLDELKRKQKVLSDHLNQYF